MVEGVLVGIVVALGLAGLVVGRWWTLVLPLAVVPGFYLGLERGWWGYGLGDGWQAAMLGVLVVALAATGVGVLIRAAAR